MPSPWVERMRSTQLRLDASPKVPQGACLASLRIPPTVLHKTLRNRVVVV
jgi:hypothetical protein